MGHNLGILHDCREGNCMSNGPGPRILNGKYCYGYMDYDDDTNYWSHCSVYDLITYEYSLKNPYCLDTLPGKIKYLFHCYSIKNQVCQRVAY